MSKPELLSDKISSILNTAPEVIDPEDDIYKETSAKVVSKDFSDDEDDNLLSKFRTQNVDFLETVDSKYAGERKSRKSFDDSFDESESGDENASGLSTDEGEALDGEPGTREFESDEDDEDDDDDDDDDDDEEDEEVGDASSGVDSEENADEAEEPTAFTHMKEVNVSAEVDKGNCVKRQLTMWESMLEMRIKLQKCLIAANKMPQKDDFTEIRSKGAEKFNSQISTVQNNVASVLNKLMDLQSTLLKAYPETKNLCAADTPKMDEVGSDEEIASDTDEENGKHAEIDEEIVKNPPRKRRKLADYEQLLSEQHEVYKPYRNNVIRKWNEKTRIAVAKSSINNNSVVNQIEYTLKDRDKCIRRTQLKRSNYKIIGSKAVVESGEQLPEVTKRVAEEFNTEIYDDEDFYHQLLRELIEVKSADITDPVKLSRQWIALQNLRSKMKRKIDTKATKGRKIRYAVHSKLVNYMAPILDNNWTDEAKTELYKSLFGSKIGGTTS